MIVSWRPIQGRNSLRTSPSDKRSRI
ncbi:hypothetical protein DSM3645_02738 [Blastopirellula marina DSM 3645]|uniref:Uncharacterized protein n=1 Tax=Blastopirellula marina DSM 3645 TaxID=314230 RepID=A3ZVL1_9BACT|nr:hypothetical protein DSM3645_02738 [Blastopirellula marina DSM 3645]